MAPTTHPQTEVRTGSGGRTDAALRYTEILELYARQAWQLDGFDADGFAATFTAGASFSHVSSGEVLVGPEAIAAAVRRVAERRAGAVHRHWFSQLLVEPAEEGAVPDSEGVRRTATRCGRATTRSSASPGRTGRSPGTPAASSRTCWCGGTGGG